MERIEFIKQLTTKGVDPEIPLSKFILSNSEKILERAFTPRSFDCEPARTQLSEAETEYLIKHLELSLVSRDSIEVFYTLNTMGHLGGGKESAAIMEHSYSIFSFPLECPISAVISLQAIGGVDALEFLWNLKVKLGDNYAEKEHGVYQCSWSNPAQINLLHQGQQITQEDYLMNLFSMTSYATHQLGVVINRDCEDDFIDYDVPEFISRVRAQKGAR